MKQLKKHTVVIYGYLCMLGGYCLARDFTILALLAGIAIIGIAQVIEDPKPSKPTSRDADFLHAIADRLVYVYHANQNVDFVLTLREIAEKIKAGL